MLLGCTKTSLKLMKHQHTLLPPPPGHYTQPMSGLHRALQKISRKRLVHNHTQPVQHSWDEYKHNNTYCNYSLYCICASIWYGQSQEPMDGGRSLLICKINEVIENYLRAFVTLSWWDTELVTSVQLLLDNMTSFFRKPLCAPTIFLSAQTNPPLQDPLVSTTLIMTSYPTKTLCPIELHCKSRTNKKR